MLALMLTATMALCEPITLSDPRAYTISVDVPAQDAPVAVLPLGYILGPPRQGFQPNINIQIQRMNGGDMASFVAISKIQFAAIGMKILNEEMRTIDQRPAWFFDYEGDLGAGPSHMVSLVIERAPGEFLMATGTAQIGSWELDKDWLTKGVLSTRVR